MSDLEIILNTCNIIDIPPNPNKKAEIITLVARFLQAIEDTITTPFVNSKIPVRIGIINSVLMFSKLKIGNNGIFSILNI